MSVFRDLESLRRDVLTVAGALSDEDSFGMVPWSEEVIQAEARAREYLADEVRLVIQEIQSAILRQQLEQLFNL